MSVSWGESHTMLTHRRILAHAGISRVGSRLLLHNLRSSQRLALLGSQELQEDHLIVLSTFDPFKVKYLTIYDVFMLHSRSSKHDSARLSTGHSVSRSREMFELGMSTSRRTTIGTLVEYCISLSVKNKKGALFTCCYRGESCDHLNVLTGFRQTDA
jgi:hypothetical protein